MRQFNEVNSTDLGIFREDRIGTTLTSLADAIENINKVASYVGGVVNRLISQEDALNNQIVNYNAAISRIEDSDVALEQLNLVKSQFLQSASITSLAQANQNPQQFLQLIQG
jgi:flagellin